MRNTLGIVALVAALLARPLCAHAGETDTPVNESVAQVIKAAGGEEKLLDVFRFHERVLITSTPTPLAAGDTNGNRTSVVKAGGGWWVGTNKRNKDKVRVLCWAWSLRILLDDNSKIEAISEIGVDEKPAFGLRVTGSVNESIDLFFDRKSHRLTAIDYTDTRHIFSDSMWRLQNSPAFPGATWNAKPSPYQRISPAGALVGIVNAGGPLVIFAMPGLGGFSTAARLARGVS